MTSAPYRAIPWRAHGIEPAQAPADQRNLRRRVARTARQVGAHLALQRPLSPGKCPCFQPCAHRASSGSRASAGAGVVGQKTGRTRTGCPSPRRSESQGRISQKAPSSGRARPSISMREVEGGGSAAAVVSTFRRSFPGSPGCRRGCRECTQRAALSWGLPGGAAIVDVWGLRPGIAENSQSNVASSRLQPIALGGLPRPSGTRFCFGRSVARRAEVLDALARRARSSRALCGAGLKKKLSGSPSR